MKPNRTPYSPEEDAIILSYCKEAQQEGTTLKAAYIVLADKLDRPEGSVSNRHSRLMKAQGRMTAGGKGISESEMLVIKLKALSNEKERSNERSDHFKNKLSTLQADYDKLSNEYRLLKHEHQRLVATVKQALGEDEEVNEPVQQEME